MITKNGNNDERKGESSNRVFYFLVGSWIRRKISCEIVGHVSDIISHHITKFKKDKLISR